MAVDIASAVATLNEAMKHRDWFVCYECNKLVLDSPNFEATADDNSLRECERPFCLVCCVKMDERKPRASPVAQR